MKSQLQLWMCSTITTVKALFIMTYYWFLYSSGKLIPNASFLLTSLQQEAERSKYWPIETFWREFKVQLHNTPTWVPSHRPRAREMERYREKYTPWCAGLGPLLSGLVLGIKSAWRWERVAATQLGGLKTHFKFCRDDMSRPPLRLCWQGWQLASFYESNLKVAESQLKLTCKCGSGFLHLCCLLDFYFSMFFFFN